MKTLKIGRANVNGVAYSADGRFLVSVNSSRRARFWDLQTFRERLAFDLGYSRALHSSLFLAGRLLAFDSTVWDVGPVWDHLNGQIAASALSKPPCSRVVLADAAGMLTLAFGSGGDTLAGITWDWGRPPADVAVWGLDGTLRQRFPAGLTWCRCAALAPDGLALAAAQEKAVLLFDLTARREVGELAHTGSAQLLRFSPDGRLLAVAAGRTVWLWDVAERRALARYAAFRCHAEALAFSPLGDLLAASSREGEVRVWEMTERKEVMCLDWEIGAVHGLAFAPDGMTMAAAGHKGAIVIWDIE